MNTLLREDRAIVSSQEGTTRDTIEEFITIQGIPLKLIDTAGIRQAKDEIEKIGIAKAKEMAKEADLIMAIFDATQDLSAEDLEILDFIQDKKVIILLNKTDLKTILEEKDNRLKKVSNHILKISALQDIGIDQLQKEIVKLFHFNEINVDNEIVITNIRHKNLIRQAIENVKKAKETIESKMPLDIIAIFIKDILEDLGKITGEVISEDIMNEIFSKFCLGK